MDARAAEQPEISKTNCPRSNKRFLYAPSRLAQRQELI